MNKFLVALIAASLTACAANPAVYGTSKQSYRPKGEDKTIGIESRLVVKQNLLDKDYAVLFKMNDTMNLAFNLDKNGNGSLSCESEIKSDDGGYSCTPFNSHKIGANCLGSTVNGKVSSVQCAFMYEDEIAANFKF